MSNADSLIAPPTLPCKDRVCLCQCPRERLYPPTIRKDLWHGTSKSTLPFGVSMHEVTSPRNPRWACGVFA